MQMRVINRGKIHRDRKQEINKIKIYGERNSGTTFLNHLVYKNLKCRNLHSEPYNSNRKVYVNGWKHDVPDINLYGNNDNILYIIVFRNLDSWLKSFFNSQWHIKKIDDFEDFLTVKHTLGTQIQYNAKTNNCVNISDVGKDIFEIRYFKFKSLCEFFEKVPNVVQVNLEYLQNNKECFVNTISSVFNIEKNKVFDPILKHTKTNKLSQNRNYNIKMTENIDKIIKEKRIGELEEIMNIPLIVKKNNVIVKKIEPEIT